IHSRNFRRRGKIVGSRIAANDKECVRSFHAGVKRIVDGGIVHAAPMQLFYSRLRLAPEIFNFSELDGFRRASFRARRLQSDFLTVVAEGAFEGATILLIALHNPKWTRSDAVATTVADIRLDENSAEFRPHNRAGGASLEASGLLAVLADIGGK